MRVKLLLLGVAFFVTILDKSGATNKRCYLAKICIHDGKEKCGQDMKGTVRRFLDSCDMKEYNCLKNANFRKTNAKNCQNLPSIDKKCTEDDKVKDNNDDNGHKYEANINESKGADNDEENGSSNVDVDLKDSKESGVGSESKEDVPDGESKVDDEVNREEKKYESDKENTVSRASKEDGANRASEEDETDESNKEPTYVDDVNKAIGENEMDATDEATEDDEVYKDNIVNEFEGGDGDDEADQASKEDKGKGSCQENKIPQKTRMTIHPGQAAVINEYWCWRTKYCHRTGGIVCGRDRRLNERRKFKTACDLYHHNCDEGHDFTVTNMKFCKGY